MRACVRSMQAAASRRVRMQWRRRTPHVGARVQRTDGRGLFARVVGALTGLAHVQRHAKVCDAHVVEVLFAHLLRAALPREWASVRVHACVCLVLTSMAALSGFLTSSCMTQLIKILRGASLLPLTGVYTSTSVCVSAQYLYGCTCISVRIAGRLALKGATSH